MSRMMVLDLDGTLVDSVPDLAAALNRLMASRGLAPFGRGEVAAMVGDGVRVLVARGFAARGTAPDGRAVDDFMADYEVHAADATEAYPGVAATLPVLVAAGWRLAVCTNKPVVPARLLLGALGLAPYFAVVGGGDSYAVRKPDPGHLRAVLEEAGGDPARAVMVGDHHNDVLAAQGCGVKAIFAAWGYGPLEAGAEAAAVAERFADLPGLGEGLVAG